MNGICYDCPMYIGFENFCIYYKIFLNANGYETTCKYPDNTKKNESKTTQTNPQSSQ